MPEYAKPQDSIMLTLDGYEMVETRMLGQEFKDYASGVKLPGRILESPDLPEIRDYLLKHGFTLMIDLKLVESPAQMPSAVHTHEQHGYHLFTVSGYVEVPSLVAAGRSARLAKPVIELARHKPHHIDEQLQNIQAANAELEPHQQLDEVQVEATDLEHVLRSWPTIRTNVTGLSIAGFPLPDEAPRLTTSEARQLGATRLLIGSALFSLPDNATRVKAMERVLVDCL